MAKEGLEVRFVKFGFILAVFVGMACSTPSTKTSHTDGAKADDEQGSPADRVRTRFDVSMSFEIGGHQLPVPVVGVGIDDRDAHLIIDSGSTHHVLTRAFVEADKLPETSVRFAARWSRSVEARVRENIGESDDVRALVGMDLLQHCKLAVPQSKDGPLLASCEE